MKQLDIAFAQERGEVGMRRAADRADRQTPGWQDMALMALRVAARAAREPFTIEQARASIESLCNLSDPPDGRAWGAVTQRAIREGVIVKLIGQYAPAASSNGSPKQLYAAAPEVK